MGAAFRIFSPENRGLPPLRAAAAYPPPGAEGRAIQSLPIDLGQLLGYLVLLILQVLFAG